MSKTSRASAALVALLFFVSGAAGLMYEIVWNRLLTRRMGGTAYSLATILTVFMGGLALGSWLGGKLSRRLRNPVRVYGACEVAIGLYCLALPAALVALKAVTGPLYRNHYSSLPLFNLAQFAILGAAILVPVALMGATLPIIAAHVSRGRAGVSGAVGWAYGVNTLGAFVGCAIAGLVLAPHVGIARTNAIAASLSIGAGLVALVVGRRTEGPAPAPPLPPPPTTPPTKRSRRPRAVRAAPARWRQDHVERRPIPIPVLLAGFGLSGFAAMTYQVAWTRIFGLSIGSATYAFTLIVGAFILGLALGSAVIGRLGDRPGVSTRLLVAVQVALALLGAATLPLLGELPLRIAQTIARYSDDFLRLQAAEFGSIFLLVLPSTFLMGGLLPLVCRELALSRRGRPTEDLGAIVGRAYASNTVGTILGSFAAGFLLIPFIGMRGAIVAAVGTNAVVAAAFILTGSSRTIASRVAGAVVALVAPLMIALGMPLWDRAVMTSAPYVYGADAVQATDGTRAGVRDLIGRAIRVIHYAEGAAATVTVTERADANGSTERFLNVAGKRDASQFDPTQALLAHLPLTIHPDPRRALIIGLGSGGTLASALRHASLERVDCVEISPEVRDAAVRFFDRRAVVSDPRVSMIIGDGRLHLTLTDRTYDVIVSQPSNPWMIGASSLFTRNAFELMRARLNPGGVVCVWMQGSHVSPESVRTLVATFRAVFPRMDLWQSRVPSDFLLTGYADPLTVDPSRIRSRLAEAGVGADLASFAIVDEADFLGHWVADQDGVASRVAGVAVSTDDLNLLEARIPRELLRDRWVEVVADWHAVRRPASARVNGGDGGPADRAFRARAEALFGARSLDLALYQRGVEDQACLDRARAARRAIADALAAGSAVRRGELEVALAAAATVAPGAESTRLAEGLRGDLRAGRAPDVAALRRLDTIVQDASAQDHRRRVEEMMGIADRISAQDPRDPNVIQQQRRVRAAME